MQLEQRRATGQNSILVQNRSFAHISPARSSVLIHEERKSSVSPVKTTHELHKSVLSQTAPSSSTELSHALNQIDSIKRSDLTELRALNAPPQMIIITLAAVMTLFGE